MFSYVLTHWKTLRGNKSNNARINKLFEQAKKVYCSMLRSNNTQGTSKSETSRQNKYSDRCHANNNAKMYTNESKSQQDRNWTGEISTDIHNFCIKKILNSVLTQRITYQHINDDLTDKQTQFIICVFCLKETIFLEASKHLFLETKFVTPVVLQQHGLFYIFLRFHSRILKSSTNIQV